MSSTATHQVYHRIKRLINTGELGPGERLVEGRLATQLGVSRVPIRESLSRLTGEGLVRREPNCATYVEQFAPADAVGMYLMRLTLEPVATQLAATHGDPKLVRRLNRLCRYMVDAVDERERAVLDRLDELFHLAVVRASGATGLIRAYEGANIRVVGPRVSQMQIEDPMRAAHARQHMQLVELIGQRRPREARRWAFAHVKHGLELVERTVGMRVRDLPFHAAIRRQQR